MKFLILAVVLAFTGCATKKIRTYNEADCSVMEINGRKVYACEE